MFGVPALSAAWAGVTTVQDCPGAISPGVARGCASALVPTSSRHAVVQLVSARVTLHSRPVMAWNEYYTPKDRASRVPYSWSTNQMCWSPDTHGRKVMRSAAQPGRLNDNVV